MWLKTDTLMPMHPKITDLADELGISRRETVGLMMDFFVWVRSYAESGKISDFYGKKTVENGKGVELLTVLEKTGWIVDGWIKNWHLFGGAEIVEKAKRDPIKYEEMIEFYGLIPYGENHEKNGLDKKRIDKKREEKKDHPLWLEFWKVVTKKKAPDKAKAAFKKLNEEQQRQAIAAWPNHAALWQKENRELQHIPYPATWINSGQWKEEIGDQIEKPKPKYQCSENGNHVFPASDLNHPCAYGCGTHRKGLK